MLRAAYDAFCERGYAASTMDMIAERAGVAVQTLYFTFHTKGAILEEAFGAAILGFDRWDPRAGPAVAADLRAASDAQVRAAVDLGERRRVEGYTTVVELLAKRGKLRRGIGARKATDILLTVLSAETYGQFVLRRGWSRAELRKWLVDVLTHQLLPG